MRPQPFTSPARGYFPAASWQVRGLLLFGLLALTCTPAFAQTGPSPAATMTTVKNIAVVFLQGAMAIGLIIGLVKVAKNFLSGSPDAFNSFVWLMGGVMIFYGWGYYFRSSLGTWSASSPAIGSIGNSNLNQAVSAGAYAMAQGVLDTMLTTVVPLLLFITIALTVVRGFISAGSLQFELGPIFRVMFLYSILISYNLLVPQVGNLIGGLAQLVKQNAGSQSTSAYTVLKQMRDAADKEANPTNTATTTTPGQAGNGTADGPGLLSGLATSISTAFTDLQAAFSPQKILMGLATSFMTGMIQAIMEFIQSFLLAFLYVCGPIAITFSLLPGFGGVAKSWLQSLIGVHMWSIAFQVIAGLFHYYQAYEAAQSTSSGANVLMNMTGIAQTKFAVACIVFIIMYIMVPYMTSLIVGSSAADSFVSSAVRIGASVASGGAAAAGAAVGVAGAGAGAANSLGAGASAASRAGAFARGAGDAVQSGLGMGPGGNMSNIATMLSGGPPPMAGVSSEAASSVGSRSATPTGTVPQRFTAPAATGAGSAVNAQNVATMAGVAGGSTSSASAPVGAAVPVAGAAAPVVAAPTMSGAPSMPSAGSAGPVSTGGSSGGFGSFANSLKRASQAPSAIQPGTPPPSLSSGGRS